MCGDEISKQDVGRWGNRSRKSGGPGLSVVDVFKLQTCASSWNCVTDGPQCLPVGWSNS